MFQTKSLLPKVLPLAVWLLLLLLPILTTPPDLPAQMRHGFIMNGLLSNTLLLLLFYLHTFVILPLFKRKGWLVYLALLAVSLAGFYIAWFVLRTPPPFRHQPFAGGRPMMAGRSPMPLFHIIPPLVCLLCSYCYRLILDNIDRERLSKEKEAVHLRTELNFLRAQVNPHFLFNILNSLTLLSRKRSEKLEPAIVNLSQLMRYMLYDAEDSFVPLDKEIAYLKSFINLQLLRYDTGASVNFTTSGLQPGITIGSLLLITLVENAFKHGVAHTGIPDINIALIVDDITGKLSFTVENIIDPGYNDEQSSTGIGLKNLRRRLDILYPGHYTLNFEQTPTMFKAKLIVAQR